MDNEISNFPRLESHDSILKKKHEIDNGQEVRKY